MVSIHHVTSYPVSEFFLVNSPDEALSIMAYTGRLYVYEMVGKLKELTDTSCGCEKDKKTITPSKVNRNKNSRLQNLLFRTQNENTA